MTEAVPINEQQTEATTLLQSTTIHLLLHHTQTLACTQLCPIRWLASQA